MQKASARETVRRSQHCRTQQAAGLAGGMRGWRMVMCCVAGALLVGGMDELHQMFLPGRSASWADLAADAAGGLLGAAALALLHRLWGGRPAHRLTHR